MRGQSRELKAEGMSLGAPEGRDASAVALECWSDVEQRVESSLDELYSDLCAAVGRWVLASHFSLLSRSVVTSMPTGQASREGSNAQARPATQRGKQHTEKPLQTVDEDDPSSCNAITGKELTNGRDPSGNEPSSGDAPRSATGRVAPQAGASRSPALMEEHGRIPTAVIMTDAFDSSDHPPLLSRLLSHLRANSLCLSALLGPHDVAAMVTTSSLSSWQPPPSSSSSSQPAAESSHEERQEFPCSANGSAEGGGRGGGLGSRGGLHCLPPALTRVLQAAGMQASSFPSPTSPAVPPSPLLLLLEDVTSCRREHLIALLTALGDLRPSLPPLLLLFSLPQTAPDLSLLLPPSLSSALQLHVFHSPPLSHIADVIVQSALLHASPTASSSPLFSSHSRPPLIAAQATGPNPTSPKPSTVGSSRKERKLPKVSDPNQPRQNGDLRVTDGGGGGVADAPALVAACVSVSVPNHECFKALWASFFLSHGSAAVLLRYIKGMYWHHCQSSRLGGSPLCTRAVKQQADWRQTWVAAVKGLYFLLQSASILSCGDLLLLLLSLSHPSLTRSPTPSSLFLLLQSNQLSLSAASANTSSLPSINAAISRIARSLLSTAVSSECSTTGEGGDHRHSQKAAQSGTSSGWDEAVPPPADTNQWISNSSTSTSQPADTSQRMISRLKDICRDLPEARSALMSLHSLLEGRRQVKACGAAGSTTVQASGAAEEPIGVKAGTVPVSAPVRPTHVEQAAAVRGGGAVGARSDSASWKAEVRSESAAHAQRVQEGGVAMSGQARVSASVAGGGGGGGAAAVPVSPSKPVRRSSRKGKAATPVKAEVQGGTTGSQGRSALKEAGSKAVKSGGESKEQEQTPPRGTNRVNTESSESKKSTELLVEVEEGRVADVRQNSRVLKSEAKGEARDEVGPGKEAAAASHAPGGVSSEIEIAAGAAAGAKLEPTTAAGGRARPASTRAAAAAAAGAASSTSAMRAQRGISADARRRMILGSAAAQSSATLAGAPAAQTPAPVPPAASRQSVTKAVIRQQQVADLLLSLVDALLRCAVLCPPSVGASSPSPFIMLLPIHHQPIESQYTSTIADVALPGPVIFAVPVDIDAQPVLTAAKTRQPVTQMQQQERPTLTNDAGTLLALLQQAKTPSADIQQLLTSFHVDLCQQQQQQQQKAGEVGNLEQEQVEQSSCAGRRDSHEERWGTDAPAEKTRKKRKLDDAKHGDSKRTTTMSMKIDTTILASTQVRFMTAVSELTHLGIVKHVTRKRLTFLPSHLMVMP